MQPNVKDAAAEDVAWVLNLSIISACTSSLERQLRSLECTSPCVLKVRSTAASLAQRERSAVATLLSRVCLK